MMNEPIATKPQNARSTKVIILNLYSFMISIRFILSFPDSAKLDQGLFHAVNRL